MEKELFSEIWTLDFQRLLKNLSQRFGGEWYLCLRVHPQLVESVEEYKHSELKEYLIDESKADDMYEVLAAMDAYITDYSSAAMDASYAHMPVFIYADDIEKYVKDRGSMLWNLSTDSKVIVKNNKEMTPNIDVDLPYSISQNNEELEANILGFDEKEYLDKMQQFEEAVELVFDGKASQRVCDYLEE